ncbi:DUF4012 domain-containing protein [Herbiconiux sp. 11R-BC]|uniref:DUF4012 domain-containing protein n=1 Tax=Herbiconiux sp. 11R-BC TaxID=3111637 RepID=UPI003BFDCF4F
MLLALVAGWVGTRAWLAKGELEAAVPLASTIQSEVGSGKVDEARATADELRRHAQSAASLTDDPIWRSVELLPWAGSNLTAFREAAAVTNDVASNAVWPLVSNVAQLGVGSFQPVNGTIDLAALASAEASVTSAASALDRAAVDVNAIDTSATIVPVTQAVGQLQATVQRVDDLMAGVSKAVTLIPRMLGAEGPRNYLLLFQNPAELRAGGGITSALALVSTQDGSVRLASQASSSSFPVFPSPVLALPDETRGLYTDRVSRYVQNTTLTPDFDLSGQIASTMWTDRFGGSVDGVISFDPVALSYLLKATGPVVLPSGDKLTAENAVKFLLSDVYTLYPEPVVQDAVFASAAKAVFDRVAGGDIDPKTLIDALVQSGQEGRFKIWSSHSDDQALLAGTTLAGGIPGNAGDSTGIGVYFNDATGAKMDYYLTTAVDAQSEVCRADGRPAIRVRVTLTNTAPADAATSLPAYVTGGGGFGIAPGNIKTLVYVYGPHSSGEMNDATIVTSVDPGIPGGTYRAALDQGYLVAEVPVELAPGETRTVTVDYLAQPGDSLLLNAQITPTINPTVYSTEINTGFSGCPIR